MIKEFSSSEMLFPSNSINNIPIVMASSEEYLPYTCVTIASILDNGSCNNFYDIILMRVKKYSADSLHILQNIVSQHSNCTVRIITFDNIGKLHTSGHVSIETYLRIMLPAILTEFENVIYLDSDLIVCHDVADLLTTANQTTTLIAAVPDLDVIGQFYGPEHSMQFYVTSILKLESVDQYMQAGVLVMHLNKLRQFMKRYPQYDELLHQRFRYYDQDVLNIICKDRIQTLDYRWNVVTDCLNKRIDKIISHTPLAIQQEYNRSRNSPWIIHFSGIEKPWKNPDMDMAEYFWRVVDNHGMRDMIPIAQIPVINLPKRLLNKCFPIQSCRREWIKTIYFRIIYKNN